MRKELELYVERMATKPENIITPAEAFEGMNEKLQSCKKLEHLSKVLIWKILTMEDEAIVAASLCFLFIGYSTLKELQEYEEADTMIEKMKELSNRVSFELLTDQDTRTLLLEPALDRVQEMDPLTITNVIIRAFYLLGDCLRVVESKPEEVVSDLLKSLNIKVKEE